MFEFWILFLSTLKYNFCSLLKNEDDRRLSEGSKSETVDLGNTTVVEDNIKIFHSEQMMKNQSDMSKGCFEMIKFTGNSEYSSLLHLDEFSKLVLGLLCLPQDEVDNLQKPSHLLYDEYISHFKITKTNVEKLYKVAKKEMGNGYFLTIFIKAIIKLLDESIQPAMIFDINKEFYDSNESISNEQNVSMSE